MKYYTHKQIIEKTGLSSRMIIYLAEKRIVVPEGAEAEGRGSYRKYSKKNICEFLLFKELQSLGIEVIVIRVLIMTLQHHDKQEKEASGKNFPPVLSFHESNKSATVYFRGRRREREFHVGIIRESEKFPIEIFIQYEFINEESGCIFKPNIVSREDFFSRAYITLPLADIFN